MKKTQLTILLCIAVVAVSMCVSQPGPDVTGDATGDVIVTGGPFLIGETMDLPRLICEMHELKGKVIVIHQTGCGACEQVVPNLREIEEENNLTFEYIDLNVDSSRMYELNIHPFYVPTVIVDCTAYVSRQSIWNKEKYETIIKGRLSLQ